MGPWLGGGEGQPKIDPYKWHNMNLIRKAMGLPDIEHPESREQRYRLSSPDVEKTPQWPGLAGQGYFGFGPELKGSGEPPGGDYGKEPDFKPTPMGIQGSGAYNKQLETQHQEKLKKDISNTCGLT